jgi:hypothetical protein
VSDKLQFVVAPRQAKALSDIRKSLQKNPSLAETFFPKRLIKMKHPPFALAALRSVGEGFGAENPLQKD